VIGTGIELGYGPGDDVVFIDWPSFRYHVEEIHDNGELALVNEGGDSFALPGPALRKATDEDD
jgi:hypothetical protein